MRYLLDTHVVIWYLENSSRLPPKTKETIHYNGNNICVCSVSLWEIAIKLNLGKLKMKFTLNGILNEIHTSDFELLQIEDEHLKRLAVLPSIHKDPFDRLLISTALAEKLTIITADESIHQYDVTWIW